MKFPGIRIWEFVEPQPSSFSKEGSLDWAISQEEMKYEGSPVKAPPPSRRRMMPPTPRQSSSMPIEEMQWQTEMEAQGSCWGARDRTVFAGMENYLNKNDCFKLDIEELELLLGPEDPDVNLRYILTHASRMGSNIFEVFSMKEKGGHLVASKVRWDECQ